MPNLRQVLRGLVAASRANADKLMQTIAGFGRRLQEGSTYRRQGAVMLSGSCHQRTKIRRLLDQLDPADATHHQLRYQLYISRGTLSYEKKEFRVHASNYFRLNNGRRRRAFETYDEQEPKKGHALDLSGAFLFHWQ